ncbi:ATP-binding protein [Aestuariibacter salexigens]|uniref:ATP-binding protein n=1 Tax=Aestuariibacter salexigens TaxID=226010 RepID=UPI00041AA3D1|nr:ATP-binding protein [Aestuariibacter salexigens]
MLHKLKTIALISIVGLLANALPAPFMTNGMFAWGMFASIYAGLKFGWRWCVFSTLLVSVPLWFEPVSIISVSLVLLHPLILTVICYRKSQVRPITISILYWLMLGLPLFALSAWWQSGNLDLSVFGDGLLTILNAVGAALLGHFLVIAANMLRPSDNVPPQKIRFLFQYLFSGVFFFSILAVSFVYIGLHQRSTQIQLSDYLTDAAETIGIGVESYLHSHAKALRAVSDIVNTTEQGQRVLQSLASAYPGFLTMLMTDAKGTIISSQPASLLEVATQQGHVDVAYRDYFSVPKQTGQSYVSDAFQGKGFGSDPIVALSAPVFSQNGEFEGIIEGSLDLSGFATYDRLPQKADSAIIITDSQNKVVFASPSLNQQALLELMVMECEHSRCLTPLEGLFAGQNWLAMQFVSSDLKWNAYALYPRSAFETGINRYLIITLIVVIALVGLASAAGYLVAVVLTRPLSALINDFNQFDPHGDYFVGVTNNSRRYIHEISELDRGFSELKLRLMSSFRQLAYARDKQQELNDTLEQKVREKTASLEIALQRANEASEAKSRFLANMSHEIRTPMNGILGTCENMLDGKLDADTQRRIEIIQLSAKNLLIILDSILDWSKIEAGKMSVEYRSFAPQPWLNACAELHKQAAEQKGLIINVDCQSPLPDAVKSDPTKLTQILNNLLSNAIKFTTNGSVTVKLAYTDNRLELSVQDTGIGISEEQQESIFQEFSQADVSTTRVFGGTGLGLTICKELTQLLGGSLTLSSKPEQGTRFDVSIPADIAELQPATDRESEAAEFIEGLKILIVEDNDINASIIQDMLRSLGARFLRARNGNEAIAVLEQKQFDLVLMDCQMPVMDGFEATRQIRTRQTSWATVPIVALTANAYAEDRSACLDAGMDDYLSKPVGKAELINVLGKLLNPG